MSQGSDSAPSQKFRIGLAGCGKMGSAMVRAWQEKKLLESIYILDPNGIPDTLLHRGNVSWFKSEKDFAEESLSWDFLILAIKPQGLKDFAAALPALPPNVAILSIMAGQTIGNLESLFGPERAVIRAMPNTPAAIGKGASIACANANLHLSQKHAVEELLGALGYIGWVEDEEKLDTVTGLSGSGPAYVFYLIEALAKAGIDAGLDSDMAMRLARQTVVGSAALADADADITASQLRENVTSPNGTTAAGLSILMDGKFQQVVSETVAAAAARSRELSK